MEVPSDAEVQRPFQVSFQRVRHSLRAGDTNRVQQIAYMKTKTYLSPAEIFKCLHSASSFS